jgi:hypothetical protein
MERTALRVANQPISGAGTEYMCITFSLYCLRITDRAFLRSGPDLPNLSSLNISGCRLTDQAILALHRRHATIQRLVARDCRKLQGHAVASLTHLDNLDLSRCVSIDKGSLLVVAANCSLLCSLALAQVSPTRFITRIIHTDIQTYRHTDICIELRRRDPFQIQSTSDRTYVELLYTSNSKL